MMDSHQFCYEYILESWEPFCNLKVFKRVIYAIACFFSAPMLCGYGFGCYEGPIGIITIWGWVFGGEADVMVCEWWNGPMDVVLWWMHKILMSRLSVRGSICSSGGMVGS